MLPVISITIPIIYIVISALFVIPIPDRALELIYVLLSMYGFSNSTLTIFFVGAYRQHTLKIFICPWLYTLLDILRLRRIVPGIYVGDNMSLALNNRSSVMNNSRIHPT